MTSVGTAFAYIMGVCFLCSTLGLWQQPYRDSMTEAPVVR